MNLLQGTKAEVLQHLYENGFPILKPFFFTLDSWKKSNSSILSQILTTFPNDTLVVRSSSSHEDQEGASNAGAFESILNVPSTNLTAIQDAIENVIASYPQYNSTDHILIQPMVANSQMSGVIMTRALEDGAPYYVINYDDESGKTDTVTGGGKVSKTVYIYRDIKKQNFDSLRLYNLIKLIQEVEDFYQRDDLDIEFAQDKNGNFILFQCRPIATSKSWKKELHQDVSQKIDHIGEFISETLKPKPDLYGDSNILGVMPDWNPAEIIGITPRPLATSLYRYIITQRVWSFARSEMGYRSMPSGELMVMLAGRPYIDVRNSFNSFLPDGIDPAIGNKLVNAWIQRLNAHPELHDKIEFEIVPTIFDLGWEKRFLQCYPNVLTKQELSQYGTALLNVTLKNIDPQLDTLGLSLKKINILKQKTLTSFQDLKKSSPLQILSTVKETLEQCKIGGTLQFSMIARHAFIAESLLRSIVSEGYFSQNRFDEFKLSINSISGTFNKDLEEGFSSHDKQQKFFEQYGHLRPGTYDILSPRYDQTPELIFSHKPPQIKHKAKPFVLTKEEDELLTNALKRQGFASITANELFIYSQKAIEGREYAKFIFTKSLSHAIESIAIWGEKMNLSREDISWISFPQMLETVTQPILSQPNSYFKGLAKQGQWISDLGQNLKLGYLIRSLRDVYVVPQHKSTPNFVTQQKIIAPIIILSQEEETHAQLEGALVCIPSADPGYDWLFSRNISGLITQYGGTNSHMTIRCSEYGIPAAIGCGEVLFQKICKCQSALLDAENKVLQSADVRAQ